jgi:LSD1 subclass zinc finger protein
VRCPTARHRAAVSSHEVGRSTESCEQRSCKPIGLPAPSMTSLFPESLSGVTSLPAPGPLRVRVHPPMNFTSPAEFQPLRTCPRTCVRGRLPWGLVPHRDISRKSPLASEHPKLTLRSALGVSHALGDLLLLLPCGFVSPHSHVRDSPSRGFLPLPSQSASSTPRALLSVGGCRLPLSCPNGASSTRPASRALIRAAIRSLRRSD